MNLSSSPATLTDVDELVLREEDAGEVSEGWREHVKGVVDEGGVWAYRDPSGALAGLFGMVRVDDRTISPWLLCSDVAGRHGKDVMRIAREYVAALREFANAGNFVFNHIPKHSLRNRAFVEHLGFRIVASPDGSMDLFYLPPNV
jgi:hypothetical protein